MAQKPRANRKGKAKGRASPGVTALLSLCALFVLLGVGFVRFASQTSEREVLGTVLRVVGVPTDSDPRFYLRVVLASQREVMVEIPKRTPHNRGAKVVLLETSPRMGSKPKYTFRRYSGR